MSSLAGLAGARASLRLLCSVLSECNTLKYLQSQGPSLNHPPAYMDIHQIGQSIALHIVGEAACQALVAESQPNSSTLFAGVETALRFIHEPHCIACKSQF